MYYLWNDSIVSIHIAPRKSNKNSCPFEYLFKSEISSDDVCRLFK